MEFMNPILDGLGWFFGLPPVNQAIGAMIAAAFGLGAFFVQNSHRERIERRRVARALLQEMLQSVNYLESAHSFLDEKAVTDSGVSGSTLLLMLPPERKIFAMLGGEVGVLSDQAAANAVAFDGTLQAIEREFQNKIRLLDAHTILSGEDCHSLALRVSETLDLLSSNLTSVVGDAYGSTNQIPESTRKRIQRIQSS